MASAIQERVKALGGSPSAITATPAPSFNLEPPTVAINDQLVSRIQQRIKALDTVSTKIKPQGPPVSLASPKVQKRVQTAFPRVDPGVLKQVESALAGPEPAEPTEDITISRFNVERMFPRENRFDLGLQEISTGIREMVAPTTQYTREESDAIGGEIGDRLKWMLTYTASLGGHIGPKGLREDLLRQAEEFKGFGSATVPAAGDIEKLAIEWGFVYPKLFTATGMSSKAIAKIPRVKQGMDALKSLGGIEALTSKYPRFVNSLSRAGGAAGKGALVGGTVATAETIGKDMTPGGAIRHISKNAAIMAGVAATFQVASDVDTRLWVRSYRNALLDAHRSHYDTLLDQVDSMSPGPKQIRSGKSLGSAKIRDLKAIDAKVARAEADLRGIKTNKLYQEGQEGIERPDVAANRAIESLKIGLGKSKPFIEMQTTRTGEAIEAIRGVARIPKAPAPSQAPGTQKPPYSAQIGLTPGKVAVIPPVGVSPAGKAPETPVSGREETPPPQVDVKTSAQQPPTTAQGATPEAKAEGEKRGEKVVRDEWNVINQYLVEHDASKGQVPARKPYLPTRDKAFAEAIGKEPVTRFTAIDPSGRDSTILPGQMEHAADAIAIGERLGYRPDDIAAYLHRNYVAQVAFQEPVPKAAEKKKEEVKHEPKEEAKAKPPKKPSGGAAEASIGAAHRSFPALQRAQEAAAQTKKNMYVVQGKAGKYTVRQVAPKKDHYYIVKPSGEATFIKQASTTTEESFDYGEQIKRQEKFETNLDEFKAKLREKNADVKAIQDELFKMVNASGMSPAKVKAVVGLLRNIGPQRNAKTSVRVLMKAIARASEYTEQENTRVLKAAISKTLKKAKPKQIHGRPKGKLTPEVQRRLDFLRRNMNRPRSDVLAQMAKNLERVQKGEMLPLDMLEANSLFNLTGIKGMSSKQMLNTLEQLQLLISQGKLAHDAQIDAMKEHRDRVKTRVLYILTGGKGLKEGAATLPETDIEIRPSLINQLNRFSSAWDNLMDYLSRFDKTSKPYQSDISKLGDTVHIAEHKEARGIETESGKVHEGFAETFDVKTNSEMWKIIHGMNKQNVDLGQFTSAIGETIDWKNLSKEQLLKKYMELQDPTLQETFTGGQTEEGKSYGMHWTQEMREAVLDNLTAQEKAWADWHLKYYGKYYNSVNEVYKKMFFVDLPFNVFYSPINRMAEQEQAEETLLFKEVIRHASTTNPSLISRVKSLLPLRWTSADKTLMNHIVRMEHFKAWAEPMNELRSIFGDTEVRQAIRQYHGKHILRRIDIELDEFAKGGINQMLVNNWIDTIRRNFTTAALARPAIAPKQIPSLLGYFSEMSLRDLVSGVSKFWLHPIRNTQQLMKDSPIFKDSVGGGYERDVRLAMHKGADKRIAKRKGFREWLFAHIRVGDFLARGPGQYAKWQAEIKAGKSTEEAMREAEKTTGRTQPGWKLSQLSAPQKGGSVWKLFTMFQTQPIRYYNIAVDNARNLRYGRGSPLKALSNIALIWVILPMLFNWIADAFQWKKKHQAVAIALGPFGYIPIAGKLITNIALAAVGEAYGTQLSPVQSIPERFKRATSAARRLFKNNRDSSKDTTVEDAIKVVEELSEAIGYVGGVPTPYLVQAERAARKLGTKQKGRLPGWRRHPAAEFIFSPYALKADNVFETMNDTELRDELKKHTYDKAGRVSRDGKKVFVYRGDAHTGKESRVKAIEAELQKRRRRP